MSLTNFPNGVSSFGVPAGLPLSMGSRGVGSVFFVDPTNGNNNNSGRAPEQAFSTLNAAYNACTSNAGDTIILGANATHTLSAPIAWTKN